MSSLLLAHMLFFVYLFFSFRIKFVYIGIPIYIFFLFFSIVHERGIALWESSAQNVMFETQTFQLSDRSRLDAHVIGHFNVIMVDISVDFR